MSTETPLPRHSPDVVPGAPHPEPKPAVAVVIPAHEAVNTIAATVSGAQRIDGVDLVLVVDDGSVDGTSAVAQQAGATVVRHKRSLGRAAALATGATVVGVREAAVQGERPVARVLLFLEAGLGYSAVHAGPLVETVRDGEADLALATQPGRERPGTAAVSRMLHSLTGAEFTDPLSRIRCSTRAAWEASLPHGGAPLADARWLAQAYSAGYHVAEVECVFAGEEGSTGGMLAASGVQAALLKWRLEIAREQRRA